MADDCKETYKQCTAARQARVEEVLASAEPWATQKELAEKAGVDVRTIKRAVQLQKMTPAPDCNKDDNYPPEDPTEQIVWYLNRHGRGSGTLATGCSPGTRPLPPPPAAPFSNAFKRLTMAKNAPARTRPGRRARSSYSSSTQRTAVSGIMRPPRWRVGRSASCAEPALPAADGDRKA
jgi:hypothetical protein